MIYHKDIFVPSIKFEAAGARFLPHRDSRSHAQERRHRSRILSSSTSSGGLASGYRSRSTRLAEMIMIQNLRADQPRRATGGFVVRVLRLPELARLQAPQSARRKDEREH